MADKKNIMQRRYSDPELARYVKREEHDGPAPKKVKAALIMQ
jgi:hypothetical protein